MTCGGCEGAPSVRVLGAGRFVRLVECDGWEYVERLGATGVVAVVAVTDDHRLLLVEQHRPPLRARVIELPAGLAGDNAGNAAEDLLAAAQRELLEETGYAAARWSCLTAGPPSAGLSTEIITFFEARGLVRAGPGAGDGSERIALHEVPLGEAGAWLAGAAREGRLIDPKVFTGLYFAASPGGASAH